MIRSIKWLIRRVSSSVVNCVQHLCTLDIAEPSRPICMGCLSSRYIPSYDCSCLDSSRKLATQVRSCHSPMVLIACGYNPKSLALSQKFPMISFSPLLQHHFFSLFLLLSKFQPYSPFIFSKLGLLMLFPVQAVHTAKNALTQLHHIPDHPNVNLFFTSQLKQHCLRGVFLVPPRFDYIQLSQLLYFFTTAHHT